MLLDLGLSTLSPGELEPAAPVKEVIDDGRPVPVNQFFVGFADTGLDDCAVALIAGAVSFRDTGDSPSVRSLEGKLPMLFVSMMFAFVGTLRRRPGASTAVAGSRSVTESISMPGWVGGSVPPVGRSAVGPFVTFPADEKIPPLMSSFDESKKAMSSIFGSTTDSAIC